MQRAYDGRWHAPRAGDEHGLKERITSRGEMRLPNDRRRWLYLGVFALLMHISGMMFVGLFMNEPEAVHVLGMTPLPSTPVQMGSEPLQVQIRLSRELDEDRFNPLGARLMREDEAGVWQLVALGRLSHDEPSVVMFEAERVEARYRVVLAAGGAQPVLDPSVEMLDGEFESGRFPTGDGELGGDFVATFEVQDAPLMSDVVVAKIVQESSSAKGANAAIAREIPTPTPAKEAATAPERKITPQKKKEQEEPQKPTESEPVPKRIVEYSPQPEVIEEIPLAEPTETPSTEPSIQDLFRLDAAATDAIIGDAADEAAARIAEERTKGGLLGGWEESWERTQGTLNGDGPKAGYGNQQAVATHTLEVYEYIAQIHKRVHKQWAEEYLLKLDLNHRSPTSPLNNPNLSTVLELELDRSGKVTDVQMVRTSGVLDYDAEAIRVAWESGPRKQVPESMLSANGHAYLHWSFWRDQRQCGVFGVSLYVLDDTGGRSEKGFDRDRVEKEEERIGVRGGGGGADPKPGKKAGRRVISSPDPHAGHDHDHEEHRVPTPEEGLENEDETEDEDASQPPEKTDYQRPVRKRSRSR